MCLDRIPVHTYNKEELNCWEQTATELTQSIVCTPVWLSEIILKVLYIRACTGFDGGFEVGAAIRRLLDCVSTGKLNINADEQYALAA